MKVARTTLCGHECSHREAPGLRPAANQGESDPASSSLTPPGADPARGHQESLIVVVVAATCAVRVVAALMVWREN